MKRHHNAQLSTPFFSNYGLILAGTLSMQIQKLTTFSPLYHFQAILGSL